MGGAAENQPPRNKSIPAGKLQSTPYLTSAISFIPFGSCRQNRCSSRFQFWELSNRNFALASADISRRTILYLTILLDYYRMLARGSRTVNLLKSKMPESSAFGHPRLKPMGMRIPWEGLNRSASRNRRVETSTIAGPEGRFQ